MLRFLLALIGLATLSAASPKGSPTSTIRNSVGFVRGTIDGKGPYWFLVDTGANRSAIDDDVAQALHLIVPGTDKVEGSAGVVEVRRARVKHLQAAGLDARGINATVSDLSGSLAPEGAQIAGIIGFDAMRNAAMLYDRRHRRIAFAAKPATLASLQGAAIIFFTLDNDIPLLNAEVNGQPVRLRLDTGASIGDGPNIFVNVTEAFYERLRAADPGLRPYTYFTAMGTGGEIRIPVVKARLLKLSRAEVPEPRLIIQPSVGYFAGPDAVGFLGAYALAQWPGFIVDYPRRRIILLPSSALR